MFVENFFMINKYAVLVFTRLEAKLFTHSSLRSSVQALHDDVFRA